jgi:AcrR family transcriptional regulator
MVTAVASADAGEDFGLFGPSSVTWSLVSKEKGLLVVDESSASRAGDDRAGWVGLDPSEDDRRPPALTRARIVRAALRLIDTQGLSALTMRALATELAVSPMALYNYVADKEELLDLTLDLMLGEVDCSATGGNWVTKLRTLFCNFHQALSAHHHLTSAYCGAVKVGPHGLKITERAIELLLQAGFSQPEAEDAFMTLYTYTVGLHQVGNSTLGPSTTATENTDDYSALSTDRASSRNIVNPYLGGVHKPGRFEYGLDTLLAGLRTKRDQAPSVLPQPDR